MSNYEDLPPRADAMIASLRAMGYDLSMAIADLIDNSISARAQNIWIRYHWDGSNSWVYILDDGDGMTESELREAMRLGSQSPNEKRAPDDLGRFGLGLKTASFSQCKQLTVTTKTVDGNIATRSWDLEYVEKCKEWKISTIPPSGTMDILARLDNMPHGTIVLWKKLDRLIDTNDMDDETVMNRFYDKFLTVREYLEMVFHRFIGHPGTLSIMLGNNRLKPWDPYLRANPFHQELADEKYEDGAVRMVPFVLPHISKRSPKERDSGAGPKGWNAQQGFYLYRNKRMIVSGGYLDFNLTQEEHYKLARIMLDINNQMDREWKIDVRKATAAPPDRLRADVGKVAKATRAEAVKIYRARTGIPRNIPGNVAQEIWHRKKIGDKVVYRINRNNTVIKDIVDELQPPSSWIRKLFHAIETTVPHRVIIMDNADDEDCHVNLPPEVGKPPSGLLELCKDLYRRHRRSGRNHEEAVDLVIFTEPFSTHPGYRAALDELDSERTSDGQVS